MKKKKILLTAGALLLIALCLWWLIGERGNTAVTDPPAKDEVNVEKELPSEGGLCAETGDFADASEAPFIAPDGTDGAADGTGSAPQSGTDGETGRQDPEDGGEPTENDTESGYGDFF